MKKIIIFLVIISSLFLNTTYSMDKTEQNQKEKVLLTDLLQNLEKVLDNMEKVFKEAKEKYDSITENFDEINQKSEVVAMLAKTILEFSPFISHMPLSTILKNRIEFLLPRLISLVSPEVVDLMILLGVSVDKPDEEGITPLISACCGGLGPYSKLRPFTAKTRTLDRKMSQSVRCLLEAKANVNQIYYTDVDVGESRSNLASIAIYNGFNEVLKVLIAHKIDINYIGLHGNTPLMDAATTTPEIPTIATLKTLLAAGADHTKKGFDPDDTEVERTALELAQTWGPPEAVRALENPEKTAHDTNLKRFIKHYKKKQHGVSNAFLQLRNRETGVRRLPSEVKSEAKKHARPTEEKIQETDRPAKRAKTE